MLGSNIIRLNRTPTSNTVVQSQNIDQTTDVKRMSMMSTMYEESLPQLMMEASIITLYDPETLEKEAVVNVTNASDEGPGSVNDPRMGVVDNGLVCATCHKDNLNCPGHLGYIKFNKPILHPLFTAEVIKVLECICNRCSSLLLTPEEIKEKGFLSYSGLTRLKMIAAESLKLPCRQPYGCINNPKYLPSKLKNTNKVLYKTNVNGREVEMERSIEEIQKLFSVITQYDAELLGFENGNHPSHLIMESLAVIPPNARPSIVLNGYVKKDPITELYINIVKINHNLANTTLDKSTIDSLRRTLFENIKALIDNNETKYMRGNKKELRTIKKRIQGKKGIIRGALMGKRINFTARTVLSPDPSLKYGQIRIPMEMAPFLTQKEVVTSYNINKLSNLLKQGKITSITPGSGKFKGKTYIMDKKRAADYKLRIGDTVNRHLMNGDYVLFNRQPTLHSQSMTGYEVVLGRPSTIGLHISDTTPKNADFDGDEGNLHALQTLDAVAEIREIMNVKNCIMNSETNKPAVGVVYDGITGAFLLTYVDKDGKGVTVDKDLYNDLVSLLTNTDGLASLDERLNEMKVDKYSGRGVFSLLLPPNFYYSKGMVQIRNGILVNGTITKDHIGTASGSIVQVIRSEYGNTRAVDFLTDAPFLINRWLQEYGFSVGLKDCYIEDRATDKQRREALRSLEIKSGLSAVYELERQINEETLELENLMKKSTDQTSLDLLKEKIQIHKEALKQAESKVDPKLYQQYIELLRSDNYRDTKRMLYEEVAKAKLNVEALGTKLDDPIEEERREADIIGFVNVTTQVGSKISTENLTHANALNVMAISGAKGSVNNIAQITGLLGQQFILGRRMPTAITQGTRCLPYFDRDDLDPSARGFCVNSFLTGLTPAELFFHQAGGREGLMDTAIKTADTGSMHRQLIKALEDIKIEFDGSVRNADHTIFQYAYGDDGFSAADLENVKIEENDIASFINLDRIAGKLNASFGFFNYEVTTEQFKELAAKVELDGEFYDFSEYDDEDDMD